MDRNADVSGDLAVIEKELQNLPGYQEAAFDLWYSESEESRKQSFLPVNIIK